VSHIYCLGGHKLISDIELPELMPWDGRAPVAETLWFKLGEAKASGGNHQTYLVPGPNRIMIEDGAQVTVEHEKNGDIVDTRALLMGPVQAILWHQRGLLPLHASAVCIGAQAILIAGSSGVGKSTLAAVLASKGHAVLADDISIVDSAACEILTGQRRLRLWRSALERMRITIDGLPRAMSRSEKYIFETEGGSAPERVRLTHIVLPVRHKGSTIAVEKLKGADATLALLEVVHMLSVAHELGLGTAVFSALTRLQASGVRVLRLRIPDDIDRIDDVATVLLAQVDE